MALGLPSKYSLFNDSAMGFKKRLISGLAQLYHTPAKILFSFNTLYVHKTI